MWWVVNTRRINVARVTSERIVDAHEAEKEQTAKGHRMATVRAKAAAMVQPMERRHNRAVKAMAARKTASPDDVDATSGLDVPLQTDKAEMKSRAIKQRQEAAEARHLAYVVLLEYVADRHEIHQAAEKETATLYSQVNRCSRDRHSARVPTARVHVRTSMVDKAVAI